MLTEGLERKKGSNYCALDDLNDLLTLRNHRSDHSLVAISEAKAEVLLATEHVDQKLLRAAQAFRALLSLPLLVIDGSRYEGREHIWQCLPYVGAGEPFPVDVPGAFEADQKVPYLALGRQLFSLSPGLVWKFDSETFQATFYFLDLLGPQRCGYRSLLVDRMLNLDVDDTLDPAAWLRGDPQPTDSFESSDGRSLRAALFEGGQCDAPESAVGQHLDHEPPSAQEAVTDEPVAEPQPEPEPEPANSAQSDHRRSRTVEELRAHAEQNGLGDQFGQLLDATAEAGLLNRPFKHGVMVAPPSSANRFLMWIKIVGNKTPYLKVTSGPDAFAEFFPALDEEQIQAALGPDRRVRAGDSVDDLVVGLGSLFPVVSRAG